MKLPSPLDAKPHHYSVGPIDLDSVRLEHAMRLTGSGTIDEQINASAARRQVHETAMDAEFAKRLSQEREVLLAGRTRWQIAMDGLRNVVWSKLGAATTDEKWQGYVASRRFWDGENRKDAHKAREEAERLALMEDPAFAAVQNDAHRTRVMSKWLQSATTTDSGVRWIPADESPYARLLRRAADANEIGDTERARQLQDEALEHIVPMEDPWTNDLTGTHYAAVPKLSNADAWLGMHEVAKQMDEDRQARSGQV